MIYNVAQLLKAPSGSTRTYPVDEPFEGKLAPDARAAGPIQGSIKLCRSVDGILLTGSLTIAVEILCCRCLEPMTTQIYIHPEEEFLPTIDPTTGEFLFPSDEEPELFIDEHHILDPQEVLRQLILVSLPMHPLCKPDCLGLCPRCGKDLNEGSCSCQSDEVDPRLAILKKIAAED